MPVSTIPPGLSTGPAHGSSAELSGIQPDGIHNKRELVGNTPALSNLFRCGHNFSLKPPGLPPFVVGDQVNTQIGYGLGYALQARLTWFFRSILEAGRRSDLRHHAISQPLVVVVVVVLWLSGLCRDLSDRYRDLSEVSPDLKRGIAAAISAGIGTLRPRSQLPQAFSAISMRPIWGL